MTISEFIINYYMQFIVGMYLLCYVCKLQQQQSQPQQQPQQSQQQQQQLQEDVC